MSGFQAVFEAYGGSYEETMERFLHSEGMYCKLLNLFFEDESLKNLEAALAASDWKGAFEAAHALKGVTGNMGLAPLYHAVCNIVEPLRAGRTDVDYTEALRTIQGEYQRAKVLLTDLKDAAGL